MWADAMSRFPAMSWVMALRFHRYTVMRATGIFSDFQNACLTHDYGYDLLRVGVDISRHGVDAVFLEDMMADCNSPIIGGGACAVKAGASWAAMKIYLQVADGFGDVP